MGEEPLALEKVLTVGKRGKKVGREVRAAEGEVSLVLVQAVTVVEKELARAGAVADETPA